MFVYEYGNEFIIILKVRTRFNFLFLTSVTLTILVNIGMQMQIVAKVDMCRGGGCGGDSRIGELFLIVTLHLKSKVKFADAIFKTNIL